MKEKKNTETKNTETKKVDMLSYMKAITHNAKVIERLQKKIASITEANIKMRNELVKAINNGEV